MEPNQQVDKFGNYPVGIVVLANALAISIYLLGALIMLRLSVWAMLAYLLFCFFLEFKLLLKSCVHCAYYGRRCFSGRGVIAGWFLKQGNPAVFANRKITWKQLLPEMLLALLPAVAAGLLLIRNFQWPLVFLAAGLLVLAMPGNGFVRGHYACCHCRQRELGCAAEKLFRSQNS